MVPVPFRTNPNPNRTDNLINKSQSTYGPKDAKYSPLCGFVGGTDQLAVGVVGPGSWAMGPARSLKEPCLSCQSRMVMASICFLTGWTPQVELSRTYGWKVKQIRVAS